MPGAEWRDYRLSKTGYQRAYNTPARLAMTGRTGIDPIDVMIGTAHDTATMARDARPLIQSPLSYDGTLEAFITQYVLPDLPSPDTVAAFHGALTEYVTGADPLFLLRFVRGTERRAIYQTNDGTRFRATDNAPAWWIHAMVAQNYRIASNAFSDVIATIPAHMFDVAGTAGPTASSAGWHIAHIFDVKDGDTNYKYWSRADVVGRFVRNIHPCNYFPIAKSEWRRWGGDQKVIGTFAALYAERYNTVWAEFLQLARVEEKSIARITGPVSYHYSEHERKTSGRNHRMSSVTRDAASSDRVPLVCPCVEYSASRLTFKRDVIESLNDRDVFSVVTPLGTFQMTKAEFYETFPNVPLTHSYRSAGTYNYATLPRAVERFRIKGSIRIEAAALRHR